ncbi:MAG: hypothetical protein WBP79_06465 [Candidatus Acidiferrales bacterium]
MKLKLLGLFAVLTLVFALAFSAAAPAAPNGPAAKAVPTAKAVPAPAPAAAAEPHPEIREAIAALRRAREHMEHAKHDFGGHRVEALRAADEAIHQLEVCLKYE